MSFLLWDVKIGIKLPFLPEDANKSTPVRHFSLSKPETLLWTEIPSDSIGKSIIKKLNFNSLTSKPFDIGDVSSLSKPIDEKKIDWNSVPDTIFDIKNLPTEKLSFKTIILENPIILKPIISPNTINGVRGLSDFKLPKDVMGKIRCSLIDENGFIWIGTEKGLFRYDGNTVEAYEKNKGLPNLDITYLLVTGITGFGSGQSEGTCMFSIRNQELSKCWKPLL
ncbi:MAG: hypothetical protein IPO98_11655 [Saprospiraceae bacterium]|nr:hypothetical protein [Saprospiraceae bacterium]